ncbi:MAG TPA: hypothetical protein EYP56_03590 [Planctomycetaceae bacterium]|nr:hypothetical protein [Planctomycetaceae bacterium]
MRWTLLWAWTAAAVVAGCAGEDPFEKARREANPEAFGIVGDTGAEEPAPAEAADQQQAAARPETGESTPSAETASEQAAEASANRPEPPRQVADVGVTGRGRYKPGLVTTPVSVFFRSSEATVFRMQIPKTMQLFKASTGYAPRSHEEFMEKIIKANMIQLPPLPPGHRYVYDPKTEQLMVEGPAR